MNSREEKVIIVRGLNIETVTTIDQEAKRQKLSRNDYLKLVIETVAENIDSQTAANILAIPLQELTSQINLLTKALNENTGIMNEHLEKFDDQFNNLEAVQDSILTKTNETLNEVTVVKSQLRKHYS